LLTKAFEYIHPQNFTPLDELPGGTNYAPAVGGFEVLKFIFFDLPFFFLLPFVIALLFLDRCFNGPAK
jgi:hypothetical protein